MKILIITNLFTPDFCGGAAQFTDLALGLKERGHDVCVYAAYPYYPEWKQKAAKRFFSVGFEDLDGVKVVRHGLYVPTNPSSLIQRLCFELSFTVVLCRSLFRQPKADVTIVFCPPLGSILYACLRRLFRSEKLWFNIQDIPTDASLASGIAKNGLFSSIAASLQSFLFRRADAVTTISPSMQNRLQEILGNDRVVGICPNWLISNFDLIPKTIPSERVVGCNQPIKLLYCGNIGRKQGLLEFCQAIQKTDAAFHFTIRGEGAAKNDLDEWFSIIKDHRFSTLGFLPDEEFVSAISDADLFVITEKPNAGFSFIPSKLIPAISLGTPLFVISDSASPLGQECEENALGLHLTWDDIETVTDRLASITTSDLMMWSRSCVDRAVFYTRDTALDRYEAELKGLL